MGPNRISDSETEPRFKNNCDSCKFLAQFGIFDTYYCTRDGIPKIALYGGSLIHSTWVVDRILHDRHLKEDPNLKGALDRAIELGYVVDYGDALQRLRPLGAP